MDRAPPLDNIKPNAYPRGECLNYEDIYLSDKWDEYANTEMTLEKLLRTSIRVDRFRWQEAFLTNQEMCERGWQRFIADKDGLHIIPNTIDCDRTFLRQRRDAAYLEAAVKYLRGVSSIPPILTPSIWMYPHVADLERRVFAKNWAVGAAEASLFYKRLVTPTDWAAFSSRNIMGRFMHPSLKTPSMIVNPSSFPKLPKFLERVQPSCHLGVETPRMGYYFAHTIRMTEKYVRERYDDMLNFEYGINSIVTFLEERGRGRVWDVRREDKEIFTPLLHRLPEIRSLHHCEIPSALGDLDNSLRLYDPWSIYKEVIVKVKSRFERGGEELLSGKMLEYGKTTLCFNSDLLKQRGEAAADTTAAVVVVDTPRRQPRCPSRGKSNSSLRRSSSDSSQQQSNPP